MIKLLPCRSHCYPINYLISYYYYCTLQEIKHTGNILKNQLCHENYSRKWLETLSASHKSLSSYKVVLLNSVIISWKDLGKDNLSNVISIKFLAQDEWGCARKMKLPRPEQVQCCTIMATGLVLQIRYLCDIACNLNLRIHAIAGILYVWWYWL